MSKATRFTFIFGVVIAAMATIILIAAYFYIWELPQLKVEPYSLKTASVVAKIRPETDISNFDNGLTLYALRGQTAIGQVVMRANKDIEEAEIKLGGLSNELGRGKIESEDIQIGLEGFVKNKYKSDPAADTVGEYPDPIIFDPQPFPLKEEKNQPLVIRISVPRTAISGVYEGKIKGYFDKIREKTIKIKLYVFDKKFPRKRTLHTIAGMDKSSIREYYTEIEDEKTLFSNLILDGLSHGINIFGSELERPFGINKADTKKLDFSNSDKYIAQWRSADLNSIYIPGDDSFHIPTYGEDKFFEYLRQIRDHYQAKGWLGDAYLFPISDPETERSYKRIKELYEKIKENVEDLPRLLTEQATPDNTEWEDLKDVVDIWIAHGEKYYEDYEAMQKIRKEGDEIGFYTPGRYAGFEGYSYPKSPTHSIDRSFNDLVFAGLEAYQNKDTYHMIWNTTWWTEANPWEDPQTWKKGKETDNTTLAGNGTGYLYYPATEISKYFGNQKNSQDDFVPSLRLLALEEGLNMYEIAKLTKFKKNEVPKFSNLSKVNAAREYEIFQKELYKNFKINKKSPKLSDDYKLKWNINFKSILPKW